MSKRNWVCFDCRSVVRREGDPRRPVVCASCAEPRINLGYKIPIPPKTRVKEWEDLRKQHLAEERAAERKNLEAEQKRRHNVEQEIARLESRPPNQGRIKAVRLLRKQLQ